MPTTKFLSTLACWLPPSHNRVFGSLHNGGFLFAWYTVNATLSSSGTQQVATAKNATLAGFVLNAAYAGTTTSTNAIKAVELTDYSDGTTYVWTGVKPTAATNQESLVKSEEITLTFGIDASRIGAQKEFADSSAANAALAEYQGTYPVTVSANGKLRLSHSIDDWNDNKYVGYYYHTGEPTTAGGADAAAADQVVNLGYVVISNVGGISYLDTDKSSVVSGLKIYVSISPEHTNATEDSAVGANYGTITPVIGNIGGTL